MGLTYHNVALLARAKNNKVSFEKILTIGHQTLYLSQKQAEHLSKLYNITIGTVSFSHHQYANDFLKTSLGAKEVKSLDYSNYEDCDIMHDMNYPIDPKYFEMFDVVIDGGSLEHIFNLPVAIENYMKMVKEGGSVFIFSMANNQIGHGFYQFSPELFFRVFQPENGFEIKDILLVEYPFPGEELSTRVKCYSVTDPALVKQRVRLLSKNPASIMVHAIRTEIKPLFATVPIQSDYLATYNNENRRSENNFMKTRLKYFIKRLFFLLPLSFRSCIVSFRNYAVGKHQRSTFAFSNKQFYRRVRLF